MLGEPQSDLRLQSDDCGMWGQVGCDVDCTEVLLDGASRGDQAMLDVLIRGGWIVDGTGNPSYPGDLAIEGERIAAVGRLPGASAEKVIDARGKLICPGLIDSHSHSDSTILMNPEAQSTIRQGITTEIVGNCGQSPAPLSDQSRDAILRHGLLGESYAGNLRWSSFASFLEVIAQVGTSVNLGWLVGHNTLRQTVGVRGEDVTAEQLAQMQALLREAMGAGALGLSTGLEFAPGRWASAEEVVALAQVVGEFDGMYASHIRNRAKDLQPAMEEFMEIVRRSHTHGQVSHLNVRHNTGAALDAWERAVATLEAARSEGWDVAGDCTPLLDGIGAPAAILPSWLTAGGSRRAAEMLDDRQVRARVRTDCDRYWSFIQRGDWHRLYILGSEKHPEIVGKQFLEIAELWNKEPWDCLLDLLSAAFRQEDHVQYIARLFTEEHVREMVRHPLLNLAVDAATATIDGPPATQFRHPLYYAGMTHYLTFWVREKHALSLEEAIRKMTSMPATRFGLRDRGLLRRGMAADVVVLDYDALDEVSTVEQPLSYCRGVEHVWVNGTPVIADGEHTGARPGSCVRCE